MIALCVLLLVFMGLLQSALLAIDSNMRTIFRDEALRIAAERMEETRSMPFDDVINDTADTIADDNLALPACQNPPVSDANPYPVQVRKKFQEYNQLSLSEREK